MFLQSLCITCVCTFTVESDGWLVGCFVPKLTKLDVFDKQDAIMVLIGQPHFESSLVTFQVREKIFQPDDRSQKTTLDQRQVVTCRALRHVFIGSRRAVGCRCVQGRAGRDPRRPFQTTFQRTPQYQPRRPWSKYREALVVRVSEHPRTQHQLHRLESCQPGGWWM